MISSFVKFFFTLIGNLTNYLGVNNNGIVLLDAPEPWQIGFQDAATPGFEGIVALHDSILFYLVLILVSVFWILFSIINNFNSTKSGITYKYLNHGTLLELIWTITPAFVLIAIAFPSFKLLYTLDEVIDPSLTIKVTGHLEFYGLEDNSLEYQNLFSYGQYFTSGVCFIDIQNVRLFHDNPNSKLPLRSIERIGPHNYDVLPGRSPGSVMFGSLLGDGYAMKRIQQYGETVRFSFKQSTVHLEYLFYLYDFGLGLGPLFVRGYCSTVAPRLYKRTIKGSDKTYYGYEFNTFSFTSLVWIYNLFYINGVKVVPASLSFYMAPLTLAIWISDDGGWTGSGGLDYLLIPLAFPCLP